jgi:hypothetical protein
VILSYEFAEIESSRLECRCFISSASKKFLVEILIYVWKHSFNLQRAYNDVVGADLQSETI